MGYCGIILDNDTLTPASVPILSGILTKTNYTHLRNQREHISMQPV